MYDGDDRKTQDVIHEGESHYERDNNNLYSNAF